MFWQTVINGLAVLLNWEIWIILFVYGLINFGWLFFISFLSSRNETAGCLTHIIGGIIIQSILLSFLIFFLLPLMLGGNQVMSIKYFGPLLPYMLAAALTSAVAMIIISFIPLLGKLIDSMPGLSDFIQALIIFRLFSRNFIEIILQQNNLSVDIYPGFFSSVGYFAIGLVFLFLFSMVINLITSILTKDSDLSESLFFTVFGPTAGRLISILPLFMYAQYVALRLREISGN